MLTKVSIHDFLCGTKVMDADLRRHDGEVEPRQRVTASRVDRTKGLGAMVASMLRELPALVPTIPKTIHARIADNIVDLIAAALLPIDEGAPLSARLTLTRVKFWMEMHLAERLSGEEIASHCGLSLRHVNRLFKGESTSLMHYVWERRLMRCWRDLSDLAQRHCSISEIAFANGFNNPSHFSRMFHARFGLPARAARHEAARAISPVIAPRFPLFPLASGNDVNRDLASKLDDSEIAGGPPPFPCKTPVLRRCTGR